jgi:two-component system chemotaxis sensor kinase CheA
MDDLIQEFIAETREMLEALAGGIVAWEAAPADRTRLDEIFRFVHTVKGNCGFFDLPRLETLSHAAEDVLADVRSGRRAADHRLVDAVLAVIDRIGALVEALERGEDVPGDDEQLISRLSRPCDEHETRAPQQGGRQGAGRSLRSIRLSVDLLDQMMTGVSDLVLARNELGRRLRGANTDVAIEGAFERVSSCISDMRDAITRTRMQRIENLFLSLPRMVRDLSAELGKQVALEVEGGDVELDREMIEMIRDPLAHIVRNAIDHGIEESEERARAGKAVIATLRISARQSGNQILIEIADDGRGVDGAKLIEKAVERGLVGREQGERLSQAQRTALIFEPGLSTAGQVTAISGRGVGMDVVRANIERIGGIVEAESKPGQGLRLAIRVPLTLTIIPALTVNAAGQNYALPRSAIQEIVRTKSDSVRLENVGGAWIARLRDRPMPLLALSSVLELSGHVEFGAQTIVVLKPAGAGVYALSVDAVHDHEELVVKPAAPAVMATGLYAGTTLGDDGRPILLLDPSGLAEAAGLQVSQNEGDPEPSPAIEDAVEEDVRALVFRTLEGRLRAVHLSVVERIQDAPIGSVQMTAGRMHLTQGGRILPLAGCADLPFTENLRIIRLSDGASQIAYGFAEVIDIVPLGSDFRPAATVGEVSGVTLVGDEQVELLDPFWLFETHCGAKSGPSPQPVCMLPQGDSWMDNILRPIVESAGYRVLRHGEPGAETADILISSADGDMPDRAPTAKLLKLRARREPTGQEDESIYRYDRAALLKALEHRPERKLA